MSEVQSLFILITAVGMILIFLGWRMEVKFDELIEATKRKPTASAHTYLKHAQSQIQYAEYDMANYWLLLAIVSLLSDEEF